MTLVTQPTADGGTLVEGTDGRGTDGITVLYSEKWDLVVAHRNHKIDSDEFKVEVDKIFGPLIEKADEIKARRTKNSDLTRIVITEGSEGVDEVAVDLAGDSDGTALKLLDEGKQDLLRWVNGKLVAVL